MPNRKRSIFKVITSLLTLLIGSHIALAQIGSGSLSLSIDNHYLFNVGSNQTAAPIILGTQLTGLAGVTGVTGNGGTTTVKCYANNVQIFSWSTSVNGQVSFPWKPASTGTYVVYCSGTWFGQHANGTVNTATLTIPVTK